LIQYFKNIITTTASLLIGLKITMLHFIQARHLRKPVGVADPTYFDQKEGIVTLQYPYEELPVPDNGRYKLHNEIDDCIVCDKCAKICPVNCIDIEPVRAVEEIGKASDGTPKRLYAAKFDIDMSKCCFCGLCTVVCPTECLTMTKEYDFSVFDVKSHNFEFGDMSPDLVVEKKEEFEIYAAEKQKEKDEKAKEKAAQKTIAPDEIQQSTGFKPKVKTSDAKPMFKPKVKATSSDAMKEAESLDVVKAKPVFKPKIKPKVKSVMDTSEEKAKPTKPVFRPKIKKASEDIVDNTVDENKDLANEKAKAPRPVFKPKVKPTLKEEHKTSTKASNAEQPKPARPVFRPKIKPKKKD
jgi:NADH-quinone oxidoreductase subunit I